MNDRLGAYGGTVAMVSVVIVCCAGPIVGAALLGLGVGAWLAAHGMWLLVGLAALATALALIAGLRRRRAAACAVDELTTGTTSATRRPEPRETGRP